MSSQTLRQHIMMLLEQGEVSAREISQEVHIREKEVYDHLGHIGRSAAASGKKLKIRPAECLHCGFVFTERKRYAPPGHCPVCKHSHISSPLYRLEG